MLNREDCHTETSFHIHSLAGMSYHQTKRRKGYMKNHEEA